MQIGKVDNTTTYNLDKGIKTQMTTNEICNKLNEIKTLISGVKANDDEIVDCYETIDAAIKLVKDEEVATNYLYRLLYALKEIDKLIEKNIKNKSKLEYCTGLYDALNIILAYLGHAK